MSAFFRFGIVFKVVYLTPFSKEAHDGSNKVAEDPEWNPR
jgi:hypothetical protein